MNNESRYAMTAFDALGIVFVTLKLCDVIDWSWWLVLLPFYGPIALILVILAVALGCVWTVALWDVLVIKYRIANAKRSDRTTKQ